MWKFGLIIFFIALVHGIYARAPFNTISINKSKVSNYFHTSTHSNGNLAVVSLGDTIKGHCYMPGLEEIGSFAYYLDPDSITNRAVWRVLKNDPYV